MKKILGLLTAAFVGLGVVSAQNLKLEVNGQVITDGATIIMQEPDFDPWAGIECLMQVTNISDKEISARLEYEAEGIPEGAELLLCGFGLCVNTNFIETTTPLQPGQVSGAEGGMDPMHLAYTPNEALDDFIAHCTLTDKTDNQTIKFNIHFIPKEGTANENRELAGVSVYPNPTAGAFSLTAPRRAQVEIFSANGQVIKQMEVAAGENALQLTNSGIYFVRVRANGKEVVKRVVVR